MSFCSWMKGIGIFFLPANFLKSVISVKWYKGEGFENYIMSASLEPWFAKPAGVSGVDRSSPSSTPPSPSSSGLGSPDSRVPVWNPFPGSRIPLWNQPLGSGVPV